MSKTIATPNTMNVAGQPALLTYISEFDLVAITHADSGIG